MTKYKLLAAVMGIAFAGAVSAADPLSSPSAAAPDSAPGSSAAQSFEQLDKNKDGVVAKDEARQDPSINKRFKELDADKDGKLSRAEYEAGASATTGAVAQ